MSAIRTCDSPWWVKISFGEQFGTPSADTVASQQSTLSSMENLIASVSVPRPRGLTSSPRRFLDRVVIDEVPRQPRLAVDALLEPRVITDVVRQALADDQADEGGVAARAHRVGEPAGAVADEVARADRVSLFAEGDGAAPRQHVRDLHDSVVYAHTQLWTGGSVRWVTA